MDPRQPSQLPFSRNAASPYNRSPFPPNAAPPPSNPNQSPYPPATAHPPPPPNPPYTDQRRSAENPYYPPGPRPYPQESNPHSQQQQQQHPPPTHGHSRHTSTSSLPPGPPSNRTMPPPGSPPQQGAQQPQQQQQQQQQLQQQQPPHQISSYGLPPPRGPHMPSGPPSFPGGRELPALGHMPRTNSTGSSMSISSMLGGPPSASRDSQPPPSQYAPPTTSAASGPTFATSVQASPRMPSAAADYQPFRRPYTPDHPRPYDPRGDPRGDPRADPRGSVAASPQKTHSTTPEMQRYGTPQSYHQRAPSQQESRESSRIPGGPPRPNSPPKPYQGAPPRQGDLGRAPGPEDAYQRREEVPRGSMEYNPERPGLKPFAYDDRYRAERERRDEMEFRERERRDRAHSGGEGGRGHPAHQPDFRQHEPPRGQAPPYNRPPDARDHARDHAAWPRPPYEQSRAPYDPAGFYPRHPHPEHPSTAGPGYPGHAAPAYGQPPPPDRYPPSSHPPSSHPMPQTGPPNQPQPFDSPERARMNLLHPQAQQPPPGHRRPLEEGPPPPSVAYNPAHGSMYDSPRRPGEEGHASQRNLLAIQEINRKGRISPLPQAVQGAQPQISAPGGEPGIKSEFGRMFSGIGSGVSGIVSSPVAPGAQLAYTNASLARREEVDAPLHDTGPEVGGKAPAKGRRRKLKDAPDVKVDEDSSGRLTPAGRTKRAKTHQHHHHHHHHHHHEPDQHPTAAHAGVAPFKNIKGGTPVPSPTIGGKDLSAGHHHHHHAVPRATPQVHLGKEPHARTPLASPTVTLPPRPKTIVTSKEVLQSVASRPRHHLGDVVYEPRLQPARQLQRQPSDVGFSSTPVPLPWKLIKDKENCTMTVKVSRTHLTKEAREEITYRRALWGTDVYTDDTDVVAACIHGGWIRGEWSNVDVNMLDLDRGILFQDKEPIPNKRRKDKERDEQARQEANMATYLDKAPNTGPVQVQPDRDMQVTILILPRLEKYSSTVRFGVKSREWGGTYGGRKSVHDGISFMITAIRWVDNGAGAQSRLRGKARRERMRRAMAEVKAVNWPEGKGSEQAATTVTSVDMTGAWRKTAEAKAANGQANPADKGDKAPSEGDKENQPAERAGEPSEQGAVDDAPASVAEKQTETSEVEMNGEKSS